MCFCRNNSFFRGAGRIFLKVIIIVAISASCGTGVLPKYNLSEYRLSYESYDLKIYTNNLKNKDGYSATGIIKNVRYYDFREFEITMSVLDATGKVIYKGVFSYFPHVIMPDEAVPFSIKLPEFRDNRPVKTVYYYRYRYSDDGGGELDFGSFEERFP